MSTEHQPISTGSPTAILAAPIKPGSDKTTSEPHSRAASSSAEPESSSSRQAIKTKRLLAVFSPWQSPDEMQVREERADDEPPPSSDRASVSLDVPAPRSDEARASSRWEQLQPADLPSVFISGLPHPVFSGSTGKAEKRFWRALVVPLLLGCVILLGAIWSRQMSLAVRSETIMLIVILGTIFLSMSALAFWLAQNPELGDVDRSPMSLIGSNLHHGHLCPRFQQQLLNRQARYLARQPHQHPVCPLHSPGGAQLSRGSNSDKGTCLAAPECLPPDYQSAISNSFPVSLINRTTEPDKQSNRSADCHVSSSVASPPYDELHFSASQPNPFMMASRSDRAYSTQTQIDRDLEQEQHLNLPPSYEDSTKPND